MKRRFAATTGSEVDLQAQATANGVRIVVEQGGEASPAEVAVRQAPNGDWLIERDGITRTVQLSRSGQTAWISASGGDFSSVTTRWQQVEARRAGHHAAVAEIRSPMTGRVVLVQVKVGDAVEKGQPLVVVEAMKMEHVLKAPRAGIVVKVACAPGQLVEGGVELIELAEAVAAGQATP